MNEKVQLMEAWGKLSGMAVISILLGFNLITSHKENVAQRLMQEQHNKAFEETMTRQVDALEEFMNIYTGRIRTND